MKVSAMYGDVIEAFEDPGYGFLLGTQFHPEVEPDEAARLLLNEFVAQCLAYRDRK